jgi:hypothetical protein
LGDARTKVDEGVGEMLSPNAATVICDALNGGDVDGFLARMPAWARERSSIAKAPKAGSSSKKNRKIDGTQFHS